jgi:hypothetical protein
MNMVVKAVMAVKTLIIVASAAALILEAFIAKETFKIEKDTDNLVKIEGQIRDLLSMADKYGKPSATPTPETK